MTIDIINTSPQNQSSFCNISIKESLSPNISKPSFLQRAWSKMPSFSKSTPPASDAAKASLFKRISNIAKAVLTFAVGLMLYWTNNSLFTISLIVGIVKDKEVAYSIDKINAVWKTQPFNTLMFFGLGSFVGGVGSILSLPVTIAAGSVLFAANLGCNLSKTAQEILAKNI